jgi:site-specific recombinase XerD
MQGDEIRALRRLQREQRLSSHVFMSERDGPMTPKAFHALFGRIGERAKMQFPIHPHMLRHGCGFKLANDGHDTRALQAWLGHRNIQHTVRLFTTLLAAITRARSHKSPSRVRFRQNRTLSRYRRMTESDPKETSAGLRSRTAARP